MVTCVAIGCSNTTSRKEAHSGITFHSFPKDVAQRNAWVAAVRRKNWTPSYASRLCSAHFEEKHIDRTMLSSVGLRHGAIPTIFPGFPPEYQVQVQQKEGCAPEQDTIVAVEVPQQDTIVATEVPEKERPSAIRNDTEGVTNVKLSGSNETTSSVSPQKDVLATEERGSGPVSHCHLTNEATNVSNSPCIVLMKIVNEHNVLMEIENEHNSPCRKQTDEQQGRTKVKDTSNLKRTNGLVTEEETPRTKELRRKLLLKTELLKESRKKIKVLQQSQRRLKKKVTSLRNVVRELKQNERQSGNILNDIPGMLGSIVKRQLQKANHSTLQKDYDEGVRSFATSLHRISQKAYVYVRQTFDCLPHPKTVSKWRRCTKQSTPNSLTNELDSGLTDPDPLYNIDQAIDSVVKPL